MNTKKTVNVHSRSSLFEVNISKRQLDYSHSSFPNARYILNHSKYYTLFF